MDSGTDAAPSCTDGIKNGSETDVDCGGSCPTKCAENKTCAAPADCASGTCTNLKCTCALDPAVGSEQGTVGLFNGGADLPAGNYEISYTDGCIIYGAGQNWTVHAYEPSANGTPAYASYVLVGETTADVKLAALPPQAWAFGANGNNGIADFAGCVAAQKAASTPLAYTHAGGKLGVYLNDSPVGDNTPGEGGKNPSWSIRRKGTAACP